MCTDSVILVFILELFVNKEKLEPFPILFANTNNTISSSRGFNVQTETLDQFLSVQGSKVVYGWPDECKGLYCRWINTVDGSGFTEVLKATLFCRSLLRCTLMTKNPNLWKCYTQTFIYLLFVFLLFIKTNIFLANFSLQFRRKPNTNVSQGPPVHAQNTAHELPDPWSDSQHGEMLQCHHVVKVKCLITVIILTVPPPSSPDVAKVSIRTDDPNIMFQHWLNIKGETWYLICIG